MPARRQARKLRRRRNSASTTGKAQKDQWRRFERRGERKTGAGGKRAICAKREKTNEYGNENKCVIGLVLEYRENELSGQEQRKKPQPKQFGAHKWRGERFTGDGFREFKCTERGGERDPIPDEIAQPQRHRHERQHHESKKRRISEAGIANLQQLAVPEASRRLRVGLHAGGEFYKARIISGRGEADAKPHTIVAKLIR